MSTVENIRVFFIAGFGPIVSDPAASAKLYRQLLGIPFKEEKDGYLHTEALADIECWSGTGTSRGGRRSAGFFGPEGLLVGITVTPLLRKTQ